MSPTHLPGSLEPFLVQREGDPQGVPRPVLDDIVHAAQTDRYAWFTVFYGKFYNPDVNLGERISQEVVTAHRNTATRSAPVFAHSAPVFAHSAPVFAHVVVPA
ncbi:hypothetical protein ACFYXM_32565 [Streptomyces sp. NPDC002476]|uniref:hypothetical protein n=1 Tax=Streptomyces sp. NPDC002476 TaxID=3364648 RepID=UPI0036CDC067